MRGLQDVSEVTRLVVSVSLLFGAYQGALHPLPADQGYPLPGFYAGQLHRPGRDRAAVARRLHHRRRPARRGRPALPALRDPHRRRHAGRGRRPAAGPPDREPSRPGGHAGVGARGQPGRPLRHPARRPARARSSTSTSRSWSSTRTPRPCSAACAACPLTFLGALILGLGESYAVGYLPTGPADRELGIPWLDWTFVDGFTPISLIGFRPAIPVMLLFVILLFLPAAAGAGGRPAEDPGVHPDAAGATVADRHGRARWPGVAGGRPGREHPDLPARAGHGARASSCSRWSR